MDDAAVAASLAYYADGVVASVLGNPAGDFTFPSKADIADEYAGLVRDDHMRMQVLDLETTGNTVTGVVNIFGNKAAYYGVNPLVLDGTWVVEDGLITVQTFTLTPETTAQLREAMMAEQVILAFAEQAANPLTPENLEAVLDFYAEDAVLYTPGAPDGQQEHAGKTAIRAYLAHDAEYNTVNRITVVAVDGSTVTARNVSWADWMLDPANDAFDDDGSLRDQGWADPERLLVAQAGYSRGRRRFPGGRKYRLSSRPDQRRGHYRCSHGRALGGRRRYQGGHRRIFALVCR